MGIAVFSLSVNKICRLFVGPLMTSLIAGRYQVVECLGGGSTGMVYACKHLEATDMMVAVKVLFKDVIKDHRAVSKLRSNVITSFSVQHPNVIKGYEYLRDGDLILYAMEFAEGGSLADILDLEELEISRVIAMLTQIAGGLQAIHEAGIVHGDLKPENILISRDGDIKITDYGLFPAQAGSNEKTNRGVCVTTIDYLSPEFLQSGAVDQRSDIYALGVLGYYLITGVSPFSHEKVTEMIKRKLCADVSRPEELRTDCPPALGEIIYRAMAREPENRQQSAAELYRDLQELAA